MRDHSNRGAAQQQLVDVRQKKQIKKKGGVTELVLNKSNSSNGVVNASYQNTQRNSMTNRD